MTLVQFVFLCTTLGVFGSLDFVGSHSLVLVLSILGLGDGSEVVLAGYKGYLDEKKLPAGLAKRA